MNPNDSDIYAGIAGVNFSVDQFDFGNGITLKKTYAHIFSPYLAAFKPAEKGKPHPAPWKAVSGGFSFDIYAELHIPLEYKPLDFTDRVNTVWWFIALLRLVSSPLTTAPVLSNKSFSIITEIQEEPYFWPIEMEPKRIIPMNNPSDIIEYESLEWIKRYWESGNLLRVNKENFNLAFQAIDKCLFLNSASLSLISIWGALEKIFSPSPAELRYRVSSLIASYLEPYGEERLKLYRKIKKLYDIRSRTAHGTPLDEIEYFRETYNLLKKVIMKIIETNKVPSSEELEVFTFQKSE